MADLDQRGDRPVHNGHGPALSVLTVTHNSRDAVREALPAIAAQLRPWDQLVVCDNASTDGTPELIRELVPEAIVLEPDTNDGFGAGCNLAAAAATNDLLLFLNPDNVVGPGFRDAIVAPLLERRGWAAWQALVTYDDGATINTWGGAIHFTGIAWAGGAGRERDAAPEAPREVPFASGACLAIERDVWNELGGFSDPYFLYHEDTDLGLRLWLAGHRVGIEPAALCDHDYEFTKGSHKWRYLERNRWATVIRTYPGPLLARVLPALLATELALLVVAARGGWLLEKLRAIRQTIAWLPRLREERRAIQATARIDPARFASLLDSGLDSAYLGGAADSPLLRRLLAAYWRLVLRTL